MIYKEKNYELSTGKKFNAYGGILGLCEEDPEVLYSGYDEIVTHSPHKDFTPEERKEIANFMIDLWTKWRDNDVFRT